MKLVACDIETTGLNFKTDQILGVAVAWREEGSIKASYYTDLESSELRELLATSLLVGHNFKFDYKFLRAAGVVQPLNSEHLLHVGRRPGAWHDTKLMSTLLDENTPHDLKWLSARWLGRKSLAAKAALDAHLKTIKLGMDKLSDPAVNQDLVAAYAMEDVVNTLKLFEKLQPEITPWRDYYLQEMLPCEYVLAEMEYSGCRVDLNKLNESEAALGARIMDVAARLDEATVDERSAVEDTLWEVEKAKRKTEKGKAGVPRPVFNWASTKQKGELFYTHMDLGKYVHALTPHGEPSLSKKDVLRERIDDERLRDVLRVYYDWQAYQKMLTTYCIGLKERVVNGRIHGEYYQVSSEHFGKDSGGGTVTGRLSHRNPNLGNLPRGGKDYLKGAFVKDAFIPDDGNVFIYADYCLPGSTEVITIEGKRTIKEVVDKMLPVLSCNGTDLAFKPVSASGYVGVKPVMRITFESGCTVDCTHEHKWMKKDGALCQANSLVIGDRLMHVRTSYAGGQKYPTWWFRSNRQYFYCHHLVAKYALGARPVNHDIDHINGDTQNWSMSNIRYLPESKNRGQGAKRWWDNATVPQRHRKVNQLVSGIRDNRRNYAGGNNPNFRKLKGGTATCAECSKTFYAPPSRKQKYCGFSCYTLARRANHRIVKIEYLAEDQPVYQITVDDWHTYVLANGLVSGNCQLELRIVAELAQDKAFIKSFQVGDDPHQATADAIGITRQQAKTVNFLIAYGGSAWRLAFELGLNPHSKAELTRCETIRRDFFHAHPELDAWIKKVRGEVIKKGFVQTRFNIRRRLPEAQGMDDELKEKALKKAVNFMVQSTAVSLSKRAMIDLTVRGIVVRNQVHDSITCEVAESEAAAQLETLEQVMLQAGVRAGFKIPMIAEGKILRTFNESF